jgi:uncharacterized membrane protein
MVNRTGGSGEEKLESLISYLLIIGVAASLLFELTGLLLYYRTYGSFTISHDRQMFLGGEDFFTFLAQLVSGSFATGALGLMTLGIAVLILTPYLRAILSVIYFASQRNLKYLAITFFVLMILTITLLLH